jgi:hypothetical protein
MDKFMWEAGDLDSIDLTHQASEGQLIMHEITLRTRRLEVSSGAHEGHVELTFKLTTDLDQYSDRPVIGPAERTQAAVEALRQHGLTQYTTDAYRYSLSVIPV